jgi:hypothetical protein
MTSRSRDNARLGGRSLSDGEAERAGQKPVSPAWPWVAVVATVSWSLWELRATIIPAQYADDSSVHEQMVRFAADRLRSGHDPLTSWFPYLGLGSPQFLHYQPTPAILTGLAGLVTGPDAAFRWSLYLLWCLWPVAIYGSARILGLGRPAAAFSAVIAPLLHSVPGIGYEQHAYMWAGFGVWTQLWGSWALPFAWALNWRALADRRFIAPAAALVALTAAFHYETGYLAFGAILVLPCLVREGLRDRLLRAVALLTAALLASAWVVAPLLVYSRWAGINQAFASGPSANGYGARVTLGWLVTGRLLDNGHLPVISLLAAGGLAAALAGWRRAGPERALVALLIACLLLSFGRTTFGSLISIVPGSADLFFRRFLMGAELAGIYLAGLGAAQAVAAGGRLAAAGTAFLTRARLAWLSWVPAAALAVTATGYLLPAWRYLDSFDAVNAAAIRAQHRAQRADDPQIAALAAFLRRHDGGRIYTGSPTDQARYPMVGAVPMYQYLDSLDIDEVGYTLRTASLMTQPEFHFDPANPGDYPLFGIRYVILSGTGAAAPPAGAVLVLRDSLLRVFELPASTYIRLADTTGSMTANRANIGTRSVRYLRSALPGQGRYLTVRYAGGQAADPTLPRAVQAGGRPGTVLAEHADLTDGRADAVVRLRRPAVVVLSSSFDPGWSATVDGRPAGVQMISPALVGVAAPPGLHRITFRYTGFGWYPELFALAAIDLLAVAAASRTCTYRIKKWRGAKAVSLPGMDRSDGQ